MRKVQERQIQWLNKELPFLEKEGVINSETAGRIKTYYTENLSSGTNWAIVAFAVLGSLLIGSGIILLFAHNWDGLNRPIRALLSYCPLIIASILSVVILIKNGGIALRETSGTFHSLAVGASIALIGQTYHLPSNTPAFMLSWALLILPLQFLLRSTTAYLIYLALACSWNGVAQETYGQAVGFWLLILPSAGRLVYLVRNERHESSTLLSFFGMLFALTIGTGMAFERTLPGLWIVAYSTLLSGAGLLGIYLYKDQEGWSNPPKSFGLIGIILLTYLFTWTFFWDEIGWHYLRHGWKYRPWGGWLDGTVTFTFITGWAIAAVKAFKRDSIETIVLSLFPVLAMICYGLASSASATDLLVALIFNGFMLFIGIIYTVLGCRNTKLRQLNGGMAILSLLLVTRFFDADFGILARGIVFIILGASFLTANLIMSNRKKQLEAAI